MSEIPFGQDGDFSEQRFQDVVNASLANNVGNAVNRCLGLLKKNCDSTFPVAARDVDPASPMREIVSTAVPAAKEAYQRIAIHEGAAAALSIARRCVRSHLLAVAPPPACLRSHVRMITCGLCRANLLLEETAPWTALKKGSDSERQAAKETLVAVLEGARIAAVLLAPVTPGLATRILAQLGQPSSLQARAFPLMHAYTALFVQLSS